MDLEKEKWKDVPGFERRYQISSHGKLRSKNWTSIRKDGKPYTNRSKILNPSFNADGYKFVTLKENERKENVFIHRLVATIFVDNPENKPLALHADGDNQNNYYKNIYWGDHSDNSYDAVRHGTHVDNSGKKNGNSKLTDNQVLEIKSLLSNSEMTHCEISDKFGVSRALISLINSGKRWGNLK